MTSHFILDLSVTIVSLTVVGLYAWSIGGHFSSPRMPEGAKLISAVVAATAIFYLILTWRQDQAPWVQSSGIVAELAATALFCWAIVASRTARLRFAFDPENPRGLVTTGPYEHIRHPFYTSYLLFWSGWAVATGSIWAIVPIAGLVVIYVTAAKDEERKFSISPMAGDYAAYKSKTGFLLPWI